MQLSPYLFFTGHCREAFTAYETILGGKIEAMMSYADMPPCEDGPAPANPELIMHACLKLDGQILMASDAPPEQSEGPMQSVSVSIGVAEIAEAEHFLQRCRRVRASRCRWRRRFGRRASACCRIASARIG